jgi:serpin B
MFGSPTDHDSTQIRAVRGVLEGRSEVSLMVRSRSVNPTAVLALSFLGALAAGCGSADTAGTNEGTAATALFKVDQSSVPRDVAPNVSDAERTQLATGNLRFGYDLYKQLRSAPANGGNLVFSPYSASLGMAMFYAAYEGGPAADEIAAALHFDLAPARLNPAFDAVDVALHGRGASTGGALSLDVANSIWARGNVTPSYKDTLAADYGTGVFDVAFDNDPDGVRKAINQWCGLHTDQKITELLAPGSITGSGSGLRTELVIVDAIDFQASWASPFTTGATAPGDFTRSDGTKVSAAMMKGGGATAHQAAADYDAYELPYVGGQMSMVLIVPHDGQLSAVEAKLDGDFVKAVFGALAPDALSVDMPQFNLSSSLDLSTALKALGVKTAFTRGEAPPLLGVAAAELGAVQQGASIDVMEAGTKAAAATVATATSYPSAAPPPKKLVSITSPFFFVLRDIPTSTSLFAGRVVDPTAH